MSNYRYESYGVIRDLKSDIPYHTDDIVDLLEGKDIHIKKLKEENQQLREDLQAKDMLVNTYMSVVGTLDNAKQLKQSQKQFTIDKLTKLYNLADEIYHTNDIDKQWLLDYLKVDIQRLNQEIKSFKGEEND